MGRNDVTEIERRTRLRWVAFGSCTARNKRKDVQIHNDSENNSKIIDWRLTDEQQTELMEQVKAKVIDRYTENNPINVDNVVRYRQNGRFIRWKSLEERRRRPRSYPEFYLPISNYYLSIYLQKNICWCDDLKRMVSVRLLVA